MVKVCGTDVVYMLKYKITAFACNAILYFQDQLIQATESQKDTIRSPSVLWTYFHFFSVVIRAENPSNIIFITLETNPSTYYYSNVHKIGTTSSFYVLSTKSAKLICASCGENMFHEPNSIDSDSTWRKMYYQNGKIPVSNLFSRRWDTRVIIIYSC